MNGESCHSALNDNIKIIFFSVKFTVGLPTPLSDRNVAKRRYITPKLFIVISFFFFPLIDNLIKFCYKQRMSHQLKNLSLLLTINEYCMFHIEAFFSPTTFSLLYFIVVISTQIELNCWAWSRIRENLM